MIHDREHVYVRLNYKNPSCELLTTRSRCSRATIFLWSLIHGYLPAPTFGATKCFFSPVTKTDIMINITLFEFLKTFIKNK